VCGVMCVCVCVRAPQPGWYFRNEALCSVTNIETGFAGCPYMFSSSATCLQSTTQRPGCAGYFQGSYQSQFRTYAMVAVGAALVQVRALCGAQWTLESFAQQPQLGDGLVSWEPGSVGFGFAVHDFFVIRLPYLV
jgi:hypothetical protein